MVQMTHQTSALPTCPHCGFWHLGACPRVKAIEYYADGRVKRVEYHGEPPVAPRQLESFRPAGTTYPS